MKHISLSYVTLSQDDIAAADRVLKSGRLRQGPECEAFESEFASVTGAEHAVTSANGTGALHLAYMAFLRPGDEVIVPSFTFIATASVVAAAGGTPVFCDVDPETFVIDLEHAESLVGPRTRAIAPVHLFGNPCDCDRVRAFADEHDLIVVWDAAQAHGATYGGRDVGSFGDFVAYSFYPSKNMFVGEGGMTCTPSADYDGAMRLLRSHGQSGKYYHTMLGLNYRMTDVEAAIGRQQLKRLGDMVGLRRHNAAFLLERLSRVEGLSPQRITPNGEHAYHQFCVTVDEGVLGFDRDELARKLKAAGIGSGVHYPRGLHQQPIFEEMYGKISLPVTEGLASRILALPVHHGLTADDLERIASVAESACG